MSAPAIELESGFFGKGFKGGEPSFLLVAILSLLVLLVLSGDENIDLVGGDTPGVI